MSKPVPESRKVSCRLIDRDDHRAIAELLARGFPGRSQTYWLHGLERLAERDLPPDVPRYGYLLETGGKVCGALLTIYSKRVLADGTETLRCNLSSWYVDPDVRGYASLLTSIAQKDRTTTYVNLTAATNTWPIIEAQGFRSACKGLFFSVPALSKATGSIERVCSATAAINGLCENELAMLRSHASLGCVSLVWRSREGPVPLILAPFRIKSGRLPVPAMRLIYAPSLNDYVRSAGAVGRFLLARGRLFVVVGADARLPGLAGFYTEQRGRRYARGPRPPSLYDLTETELVFFQA